MHTLKGWLLASLRLKGLGIGVYACVLLALTLLAGPAAAESLTSVNASTLPALPEGKQPSQLLTVGQRNVALAGEQAWVLAEDGKAWAPLSGAQALTGEHVIDVANAGSAAIVLMGDGSTATGLQRISLRANAVTADGAVALPEALQAARITALGDQLYLAGQRSDGSAVVFRQPFNGATATWTPLPAWPNHEAVLALQGQKAALYAVLADAGGDQLWRWTADYGWQAMPALQGQFVAGSLRALGQAHLMMMVRQADGAVALRTFHTITGAWASVEDAHISAPHLVAARGDGLVWSNGSEALQQVQLHGGKHLLRTLDWVVIAVYLIAMLGMGFYFYLKDKNDNTADFFVGGRSIPFWAAGISLYATNTSSISFIAIPAKAFDTNWQYMTNNLMAVLGLVFVAIWIVPLLRRLDLMSVFSYLETRFHPAIRMLSSALCIAMQIGARMSVILFLPALAISTITGLDVIWSILMMGVFTIIYSTVGGSKAVIWTDVVQVIVMFGGALFAIGFIFWQSGADLSDLMAAASAENKTKLFDFSFDLTKATVWGFIFLVVFDVVLTFPKDQVLMQRTLSTKSDKEAGRSIWTFAAIMVPGGFVFYGIGTALWMYYRNNPERLNPLLPIDATFPLFIAAELPAGVTGLIIAGIFAAAMSTLSSIINSVSTLVSVDFYQKIAKNPNEKTAVRIAEWSGVGVGVIGIIIALVMSRYDITSLFDVSIELAGLLGGGFAGAYTLGMFTRRANSQGVAIGVAGSIIITLICWSMNLVHPYFYLAISIALCIGIGYVASFFFPPPAQNLDGLTIHTRSDGQHAG